MHDSQLRLTRASSVRPSELSEPSHIHIVRPSRQARGERTSGGELPRVEPLVEIAPEADAGRTHAA